MCRLTRPDRTVREHRVQRVPRRRFFPDHRIGDDGGAVAAIVAVLLGMGVLLGTGALVIDVAMLYVEREELQSGADAAAWAVAEGCVRVPDDCAAQLANAREYAVANAADGASAVTVVCGRGPDLAGCPAAPTNRSACLGTAPTDINFAEVRTRSQLPDGRTMFPPAFAGALSAGYEGTEVDACSRVAWGPPRSATALALTFSTCEFNALTDNGTTFFPPPGEEPAATAAAERVVKLKGKKAEACPEGPPGAFGWLDDPSDSCTTTVDVDGTFGGDPGNSRASRECETVLTDLWVHPKPALIPIYDETAGSGQNATYGLAGFASFVITGYFLTSVSHPSSLTGNHYCGNPDRCLYGYFTRGLVPTTGEIGGDDLGVAVLNLVG